MIVAMGINVKFRSKAYRDLLPYDDAWRSPYFHTEGGER